MRRALTLCLALALMPGASVAQVPTLQLASPLDSLSHEFTRVASVRELADGRVLVIDSRDRSLYVVAFEADEVAAVGRTGRGPQEYERPTRLVALAGDSTVLLDPGTRRWLVLVGPRIVGTLSPSDSTVERSGTAVLGADRVGHVVSTALVDREVVEGDRQRDRVAVRRTHRATARTDTLLIIRGVESTVQVENVGGSTRRSVIELAMSVPEQALLFPDGWLAIARQHPYRIDWRTPEGELIAGTVLPWPQPPVSAAEIEVFRRRMERQLGRSIPAPLTGMPFVDQVPPFTTNALQALPDGSVLIARSEWSGSRGTEYDVVGRRGRLTGQARLPANIRIVGVSARHVYTVSIDPDGIERLRRHRWSW